MPVSDKLAKGLKQIVELKTAFARAEIMESECSKLYGNLNWILLNELRYAGFHLLSAVKDNGEWDEERMEKSLTLAIEHCQVAICDSLSLIALYLLDSCRKFAEEYKGVKEVYQVIENYDDQLSEIAKAQAHILDFFNSAKTDGHFDQEKKVSAIEGYMETMGPHIETLRKMHHSFRIEGPRIDTLRSKNNAKCFLTHAATAIIAGLVVWFLTR